MTFNNITRRDFLKLSASGVLGLALSELGLNHALAAPQPAKGLHSSAVCPFLMSRLPMPTKLN